MENKIYFLLDYPNLPPYPIGFRSDIANIYPPLPQYPPGYELTYGPDGSYPMPMPQPNVPPNTDQYESESFTTIRERSPSPSSSSSSSNLSSATTEKCQRITFDEIDGKLGIIRVSNLYVCITNPTSTNFNCRKIMKFIYLGCHVIWVVV